MTEELITLETAKLLKEKSFQQRKYLINVSTLHHCYKYLSVPGYFEMTEKPISRKNHPGFIVMVVTCTQKGLAYINHLFGGNPSDGKLARIR